MVVLVCAYICLLRMLDPCDWLVFVSCCTAFDFTLPRYTWNDSHEYQNWYILFIASVYGTSRRQGLRANCFDKVSTNRTTTAVTNTPTAFLKLTDFFGNFCRGMQICKIWFNFCCILLFSLWVHLLFCFYLSQNYWSLFCVCVSSSMLSQVQGFSS